MLDIQGIQHILPQRFPFLMIDRVIEWEPAKKVVAVKNVSINEQFFSGHFPFKPVMPGVLIIEAMAQASILLFFANKDIEPEGNISLYRKFNKLNFRYNCRGFGGLQTIPQGVTGSNCDEKEQLRPPEGLKAPMEQDSARAKRVPVLYYLGNVKVRFLNPVFPGDQLEITVEPVKLLSTSGIVKAQVKVLDKEIAKGELGLSLKDG